MAELTPPGNRCRSCGVPLASDQRYCLNCGERRGQSRFSLAAMASQAALPAPAPPPSRSGLRSRIPTSTTLVTGVATLLLAMGVGVLIGHDSNTSSTRASQPLQVVTVGGGGAVASTPQTSSAKGHAAKSAKKAAGVKPTVVHVTKQVLQQGSAAVSKVFGQSHGNLPPAGIQPGQKCAHGAGCQHGKFTGNFFH